VPALETNTAVTDPLITEVAGAPLELFDRWEQQQWSLIDFDFAEDRDGWANLRGLVRRELRGAIENFLVGENAVTETLAPLVYAAPTPQEQLFLTTQLVDEARHTLLFARYLAAVEGTGDVNFTVPAATSLTDILQGALREATSSVRESPQERDAWYRAIVVYHLLIEGVLAVSGMRSLLGVLRGLDKLPVLARALTNVARDESRHIGFGVTALRAGVAAGHADVISRALSDLVPHAVRALLNPDRMYPRLAPESSTREIATSSERLWGQAERALIGRAKRIGLSGEACEMVRGQWAHGRDAALDEYHKRHGSVHPVQRAVTPQPAHDELT
jgi:ribonucleoside-diphosphate reductase beta chain